MKFKRSIVRSLIHVIALTFLLSPLSFSDEVGIDQKIITFWSDGSRLQGTVFTPKDIALEEKLPGILLIHGWGGHRGNLNKNYAPHFAKLGFVVMTFDLRSWGESDGFFVAETTLPPVNSVANVDVSGQHIRSIVNPFKMLDDARAALSWFVAEPNLQANNIGVWGTSFGGSLAVVTAANDRRVKALVTQMAPVNNQATFGQIPEGMVSAWETQRARGEITPYPGPESASPGLRGYPDMIAMKRYDPAAYWPKVSSPTLIIDAENEELFDRRVNGLALHQSLKERIATNYKVIEGKHYDLYRGDGYEQALKAAQDWFLEHLK